jgi:hypothetical protein
MYYDETIQTLQSKTHLEKLIVAHILKKLSTVYGTRKFIAVFTKARK